MEDKSFEMLLESIGEMKKHINGEIELKKTIYEIVEVPVVSPEEIKLLRMHMSMTQKVFGKFLGVSTRAVESWEGGITKPSGPARRMMSMLEDQKLSEEMTDKFMVKSLTAEK